ncbi:MAG TPA: AI-2E family transporter [Candidatus Paceibacterota bacterium]|nr:AI-2E family transporter [Candidatus Paceibacterota bacterium]
MEEGPKKMQISISTSTLVKILLFGVLVYLTFKLFNLILVILTAIVVASFVEAAVVKLKPYLKNRALVVFTVYILAIGALIGLSSVFVPVFIDEMNALVTSLGKYIPDGSILNTFQTDTITGAKDIVTGISSNASIADIIKATQDLSASLAGGFLDVFGSAFGGMFNVVLIFILSIFLSLTERGVEKFLRIITPRKQEEYVIGLWQRTERKIGLWFQGQMLLGIIMGLLVYLILTIMGVKYSLVLALLTACCELIPFGIFIALIPATVFAYLDGGITLSAITLGVFLLLHQFENYLIYPLIVKNVIGISPLVVILSVLVGGHLAGFWGVVLAIPTAVCIMEFFEDVEKKKILANISTAI